MNFKKRVNGSWTDTSHYIHNTSTDIITTLPAVIYPTGTTATVGLKGQTTQSSIPSPTSPVMPQGTGDKTANLFDGQLQQGFYAYMAGDYTLADTYVCTHLIPCTENTTYTFRCINTGGGSKNYGYVFFDSAQNRIDSDYINVLTEGDVVTHTATTPQNTAFLAINVAYGGRQASVIRPSDITDFMLNTGSTALPYEPYGYKIPISSGGVTTNIYLDSTQTTRQIKKYVLTGNETIGGYDSAYTRISIDIPELTSIGLRSTPCLSSHYIGIYDGRSIYQVPNNAIYTGDAGVHSIIVKENDYTTRDTYKAYLQAQYAAGTPVTIWFAMPTAETAAVNEPLMKIGDYADIVSDISVPVTAGGDTISVDTTVQPSETTVTWAGWHNADVKEYHTDKTISDLEDMTILQMQTCTIASLQGGNWV